MQVETTDTTKKPREHGTGSLLQVKGIWHIRYYVHGKQKQESTRSADEKYAKKLLKTRVGQVAAKVYREPRRLRYEDLRAIYLADYVTNKRKSLRYDKDGEPSLDKVKRLDEFFKNQPVPLIDTELMEKFIEDQRAKARADSTTNRSLSALRRMFHLAVTRKKLQRNDIPHFPMLPEPEARKGFFEHEKYVALRDALPNYLRPVLAIGYHTGMRLGEICGLRWSQVDFLAGVIRLNPGETKNDEGRTVPLIGDLRAVLTRQHANRLPGCDLVCFRVEKGQPLPVGDFRKVWQSRCVKLGFGTMIESTYKGTIFHDLRRTGVRNLVRAGVPESVAMTITGHKTRSVFNRYNITSEKDILEAGAKLETYLAAQNEGKRVQKPNQPIRRNSINLYR